jgi:hypothetical protein
MWYAWGEKEIETKFWSKPPKGRNQSGELGVDGRIILKLIMEKYGVRFRTGLAG